MKFNNQLITSLSTLRSLKFRLVAFKFISGDFHPRLEEWIIMADVKTSISEVEMVQHYNHSEGLKFNICPIKLVLKDIHIHLTENTTAISEETNIVYWAIILRKD